MKTIYLIHGWSGSPTSEPWFEWLGNECRNRNYKLIVLEMPNTEHPKIEEWVKYMENNIKNVDKDTYFVGHSIGCQTIMRYLEKLPKHKIIGGCVFVAGWFNLINLSEEETQIAHPWINTNIDFERIRRHTNNFLAIFSDDDPNVHLSEKEIFKDKLGSKIIIKKGEEHFNDTKEIKEIIGFIGK